MNSILLDQSIDPLSKAEERNLLILAKQGDLKARHKLVQSLMRYGVNLAKKYNGKGMDEDDYIQLAMIGILEAIDTFDLEKNCRLTTHMTWRVRRVMTKAQMSGELIRVPSGKRRHDSKLQEPKNMMSLPEEFDLPVKEKEVPVEVEKDSLWFMPLLTRREKLIIECRYALNMTLQQTGERIGVTRERIRQITAKIFLRVRYAEANSRCEKERTRLFHRSRRAYSRAKKPWKNTVPGLREQVDECGENRRNYSRRRVLHPQTDGC